MRPKASQRRRTILERRARFVALAVAGAGVAAAASCQPCLKMAGPGEDGAATSAATSAAATATATATATAAATAPPAEAILQDGGAPPVSTSTGPQPPTD